MFALIQPSTLTLLAGPLSWSAEAFRGALLQAQAGFTPHLPVSAPASPLTWQGADLAIVPVIDQPPTFDPATQALDVGAPLVTPESVTLAYTVRPLTAEEGAANTARLVATYQVAVQGLLDAKAQERNYDGILSACSYAASSNAKFGPEGKTCVDWRDSVWASCYATLAQAQAGAIAIPNLTDFLAGLPPLVWPT